MTTPNAAEDMPVEERVARARYRRGRQLARTARRAAERARRRRLRALLAQTAKAHPRCRCQLRANMTLDELMRLGAGCTGSRGIGDVGWVCPRLNEVRRKLGI